MSQYLCPPLHSKFGRCHTPNLYIFMIPHKFQIYMHIFRSPTWFTYFRSHGFWVRVEHIFVIKFCFIFGGHYQNMATKLSIIGIDPYVIPHFNANRLWHAIKLQLGYFHNHARFASHLNGSKVANQETDFLKNRSDTLRPPYPAKLRSDRHKTTII